MTPGPQRHLWPNVGAEEGDPARFAHLPAVASTRRLWAGLFDRGTTPVSTDFAPDWADAAAAHEAPALGPLADTRGLVPWLVTKEAGRAARDAGVLLEGPAADVVTRVHDKAFAARVCDEEATTPRVLRAAITCYDADALRSDARGFARSVAERAAGWPAPLAEGGFTVKPRLGTSGRGRIGGAIADLDIEGLERAAARLADRGGAILEPWLKRTSDLSVVAWLSGPRRVVDAPALTLLAGLTQLVTPSGLWLGHRGEVDRRGRIYSGTTMDDAMREAAAAVANAAHREGYWGPCGVDGFTFVTPDRPETPTLRPAIELNARFTMGHVCAGWVRRALPWLVSERGLSPGRRIAFVFALAPPHGASGWRELAEPAGADVLPLAFATPLDLRERPIDLATMATSDAIDRGPALVFHDDPAVLDDVAAAIAASGRDA